MGEESRGVGIPFLFGEGIGLVGSGVLDCKVGGLTVRDSQGWGPPVVLPAGPAVLL